MVVFAPPVDCYLQMTENIHENTGPPLLKSEIREDEEMDEGELVVNEKSPASTPRHDNDASSTSSGMATDLSRSPRSECSPSSRCETGARPSPSSSGIPSSGSPIGQHASQIEKKHICEMCGKAFPYLSILESHKRCHTGEKPFNCHYCEKRFAQKATLQVHERTHTGERPYKCRYCDKTFAQYGTKTVHEKSAHLGIRNYKCPKCDKCLSSPSALYTHKKTHGEKVFHCEFCPKTFTLKNYLKLHVKQVHEQTERKHVCTFCSKSFAYAGSLQVHVRTHTGERPYVCRYCPKAFASQGNLQSHERTHTGERPYTCDACGRSFIQKSQLTAHEATHGLVSSEAAPLDAERRASLPAPIAVFPPLVPSASPAPPSSAPVLSESGERPGNHECRECGKRYAYASSLYVHARVHTGERPFRCNYCDKTFTNQGNMQVHLRVHTGEKPYRCIGCDKSYAQKVGLKIHHEQCAAYISSSAATSSSVSTGQRSSESPLNVETSDDDSGRGSGEENVMLVEGRKLMLDATPIAPTSVPNIYANIPVTTQPSSFTPTTPTSSLPFALQQLQQLGGWPMHNKMHNAQTAPLGLSDFGSLSATKPSVPQMLASTTDQLSGLSDSVSSAFAPVQSSSDLLLKGLLNQQPSSLLTSLLLQQLQSTAVPPPPPPPSSLESALSSASTLDLLALLQAATQPTPSTPSSTLSSFLPPNLSPTNSTAFPLSTPSFSSLLPSSTSALR